MNHFSNIDVLHKTFSYVKVLKTASGKYYQKKQTKKKRFEKKLMEGVKTFLKKGETKNGNMVVNDIKIFLKMKNER